MAELFDLRALPGGDKEDCKPESFLNAYGYVVLSLIKDNDSNEDPLVFATLSLHEAKALVTSLHETLSEAIAELQSGE